MRSSLIILFCLISIHGTSQFYPLEVGGVGGQSSGINFRAYLSEELSYEAILSFRNKGVQANLLRQGHIEMDMTARGSLYFVYGYGAHLGFYYDDNYTIFFRDIYYGRDVFSPVMGADGYAGLEYRFHEIPLSFGLSYKPFMELSLKQIFGISLWDFGFTARYRFKPQNAYY